MDKVFMFEPLALEYLGAAMIADGHETVIVDSRITPDIDKALSEFAPDIVGITSFTSQVNISKNLAAKIKSDYPDIRIFIGGHHATVSPEDFNEPFFDAVVIGEGVFTLRELVKAETGYEHIKGLGLPSDGGLRYTEPRQYTPLDELPLPARYLTREHRKKYFSEWFAPIASVRTSLGCTARCTFCALWSVTGGKYLRRDISLIIEELKQIEEPNIFFCDDESMCDHKRMELLADWIKEAGIRKTYFLYARVDTIVRHPELFRKWADVGLKQVFVGMEDCSDERLRRMKKNITSDQQKQAVKILKDLGIMMYASFMVSPDYTPADFKQLKGYVRRLKLTYATFTVMTPLPGTELYRENREKLLSEKPELFDMIHALLPTAIPLKDFYTELADLYATALPLYKVLPTMFRFGLRGISVRLKLFKQFLEKVTNAHLDY